MRSVNQAVGMETAWRAESRWGKAGDFVVNCPPSVTDEMDASAAEKLDTESVQTVHEEGV